MSIEIFSVGLMLGLGFAVAQLAVLAVVFAVAAALLALYWLACAAYDLIDDWLMRRRIDRLDRERKSWDLRK